MHKSERELAEILPNGLKVRKRELKNILMVWKPKALKPFVYYMFPTVEKREEYLNKVIKNHDDRKIRMAQAKQAQKLDPSTITVKRGDIFYTSWGYDQTNYDYIVVLSIKGLYATCQRTSSLHMGQSCQSNVQEPVFCPFGEIFRMKIVKGWREPFCLRGSYPYLHTGIGSKRLDSFFTHTTGKQYHETMSQYGH